MPTITPFLWFNDQAEEAANFYVSVFKGKSRILSVNRYGEAGPGPKGGAFVVAFELDGRPFIAMNGGPRFKFTEAISLAVHCKTQREIDAYWEELSAGGEEGQCGWLKDKYGLSWQVVPTVLAELMNDPNPRKSENVMKAVMKMRKLDIQGMQRAYEEG